MITFKAIIIPNNRRKDGTYPVKIRVTFKGVSRRLPTTLVCKPTDITKGNRIKNADILSKSDTLIVQMREAVRDISPFELENRDVDWVVSHIREKLGGDNFRLDFFEWCDQFMLTKSGVTRRAYAAAVNSLERFLGTRELDINDITRTMLIDFMDFIDAEPKMWKDRDGNYHPGTNEKIPRAASSRHLMKLQHMFNAAKDKYNDEDAGRILIPKSPFDKIKKYFPAPTKGQKNLGQPLMQKIINAQTSDQMMRYALDTFIVSFGLMGANLADMFFATPFTEVWVYNRQKTRTRRPDQAEHHVAIPEVLKPYIRRLQQHRGDWWLPTLHHISGDKDLCATAINRRLKRWARENGVPEFTFYAARHTWASIARKAGVEKATVDECLCHKGDFVMADIYAERNWELMQAANQKVLDIFEW